MLLRANQEHVVADEYTPSMLALLFGFALSATITFLIIRWAGAHLHFSGDMDLSGPQKFHGNPVPRVGGIGIVVGL